MFENDELGQAVAGLLQTPESLKLAEIITRKRLEKEERQKRDREEGLAYEANLIDALRDIATAIREGKRNA